MSRNKLTVLSISKEGAIQRAYTKALSHPGVPAYVAEHGGNRTDGRGGGYAVSRYRTQFIFAACLIEDGQVCRWHYMNITNSGLISANYIARLAGFRYLGISIKKEIDRICHQESLQELKDLLIISSGKFFDRTPLFLHHKNETIRNMAK